MAADELTAKRRLAFQKSYSLEHGGSWHRPSLIDDAKFDTITNAEFEKQERSIDGEIAEEGEISNGTVTSGQDGHLVKYNVIMTINKKDAALSRVFKVLENSNMSIVHVETRSKKESSQIELLVQVDTLSSDLISILLKSLQKCSSITDVTTFKEQRNLSKVAWFPRHISDLDRCTHLLTKFDPGLDYDHPGFGDKVYRTRRTEIANIAFDYKYGQPIPRIEYTEQETKTWAQVYRQLVSLYPTHACKQHIEVFSILEKECGYSEHAIPQLEDISNFLKRKTGFQLRPVAGLLSARDFLASLAFRVFQCTQYIRHPATPDHTVEPDCVHEILGHMPMLADASFAQFSQEIGLATLGASDEDIEKFATLYWFTVEFGLCRQDGQIRAYGAGLLSAYGELQYALSDKPERREFNPQQTAVTEYDDQAFQKVYFVSESFEDVKEKLRAYAASIRRCYDVRYNPYTQSIQVLDNKRVVQEITQTITDDLNNMTNVLKKLNSLP